MDKLDELLARYCDEEGWKVVSEQGPNSVSYKMVSSTSLLVRTCSLGNIPFAQATAALRPEALMGEAKRYHWRNIAEASILKSFGAGDVVGWLRFSKKGVLAKQALLQAGQLHFGEDELEGGYYRVRLQRDYPVPGAATLLMVPLDAQRYEVHESLGMHRAATLTFTPIEGGAKSCLRKVTNVSRALLWTVPMMLSSRACPTVEVVVSSEAVEEHQTLVEKSGFLVVRIRKCCGGPPLLPQLPPGASALPRGAPGELEWMPVATGHREFQLADYLQKLLHLSGMRDAEIFDSLDNRRLVFYEAAARRADWPRLWEVLEPLMTEHRTAYRRKYGSSSSPHLDVDVQPRFCEPPRTPEAQDSEGLRHSEEALVEESAEAFIQKHLPVKNTFVHFNFMASLALDETLSQP